ncbi:hypothetical protein GPX89_10405 [Nocardia sp. ET3-3]|uniref:Novel STAND NTPase 1 domain-containing protein n=1 Tax=Nocardia terrae TaxID=2675851 RepID=A0A7K1UTH9_9NOCA|nr:hypothetical protein [Nocardia terrae]MVU77650.1 hypothetical protein [Nocardia terrae]
MVAGDIGADPPRSPRAAFAQRFTELYAAAGNPTLRRVANAAEERMRAARGTRPGGASAQRISDWKAGRNVPARFESLLPVVLTLAELARKTGAPAPRPLADPAEWQRIWQEATSWNPQEDTEAACPYQGLRAYGPEHRTLFFGRTRAVGEIAAMVRSAAGIIALVGASGAGKSSLLAAGLGPELTDWEITTLTPGAHPSLAEDALAARADGPRRLVIVDQFEELFTVCDQEHERELFLKALDACARRTDDPIAVVIALRADFYAHCLNYLILQDALEHRGYLLGPLRMDELSQAVSGPARAVGLDLEPGLEELITTELCGAGDHHDRGTYDPGALPMLSHVMAATWQHREGRRLTIAGYRQAGGVVGSVAETAEYAWNELSSDQQTAARTMLLGLVTVSQDARDTRRTVPRDELLARTGDHENATAALELLSRTRLVTLDADAVTLTHEIVLTAWPRLRDWIDEDRVGYLIRQRIETDAAEWVAQDRDPSLLYRGNRLQNAREHADPPPVGPLAQEFLARSVGLAGTSRRRSRRLRAVLALLGVGLLVLGIGLYAQIRLSDQRRADNEFAAILLAADRAQRSDPSLAAQLNLIAWRLRPGDPTVRSRLLQSQATPLLSVTPGHTESITRIAYRPAARTLVSLDLDGDLRVWDTIDPKHPRQLGQQLSDIGEVAVDPTARLLATAPAASVVSHVQTPPKPIVTLWDTSNAASPRQIAQLPTDSGQLGLAFGPDGRTLATMTWDRLTLWDVSNPTAPIQRATRELHGSAGFGALHFSPDGRLLARIDRLERKGTTPLDSVELWNVADPGAPTPLAPGFATTAESAVTGGIQDLSFRPDSALLAVGMTPESGSHAIVQLWDIADPAHPRLASGREIDHGGLSALDFAPDGHSLAAAVGKAVTVLNVTDPADPTVLVDGLAVSPATCRFKLGDAPEDRFTCYPSPRALAFTGDGRGLIAGASTGDLHTWSLPPALTPTRPGSKDVSRFEANGTELAIGSASPRSTALWNVRNPQAPELITEYNTDPGTDSTLLAPDGSTLLELDMAHSTMTTVDLSDPAAPHSRGAWTFPGPKSLRLWSISDDFRTVSTVDEHHSVQLWDLTDPLRPAALGGPIQLPDNAQFDFGPDSKTMIETVTSGTGDNAESVTTLWSLADRSHPSQVAELMRTRASDKNPITFAPDMRTMVVSANGTMQPWDISDPRAPRRLGHPIATKLPAPGGAFFTLDSRTLFVLGFDNVLRLWDFTDRDHPSELATLTPTSGYADGSTLAPGDNLLAALTADGTFALWDLDTQHAIDRICEVTGTFWTEDLWKQYLPSLPYHPYCHGS